jgi:hypothetical protein
MSRAALSSSVLMEEIKAYDDLLNECARDGVIAPDELRQLVRRFRPLVRKSARLNQSLRVARLMLEGDGIDSDWAQRLLKEDAKRQTHLRLVAANDDGPEPSGPVAAKRRAA